MAAPNLIPKEQLSAYERWELNSFDVPGKRGPVALTTAAQVEKIHQQARLDGYQTGLNEGRQRAGSEAERLAALARAFSSETAELDQRLAQQVLDVALDVARQMLRGALEVRPELILPVIQEAIRSLPVLGEERCLRLHPQDVALARELAGESLTVVSGWTIVEDAAITRGGCVVCTSHGEVDATLDARWRRIVGTLGREGGWLGNGEDKGEA
ncbi:MAG: flagellar assembly protein FliH [Betaproteobacteria bacterium]|nr:flagellar assembly protein FliH [Betaproteobacteria bacterium]